MLGTVPDIGNLDTNMETAHGTWDFSVNYTFHAANTYGLIVELVICGGGGAGGSAFSCCDTRPEIIRGRIFLDHGLRDFSSWSLDPVACKVRNT